MDFLPKQVPLYGPECVQFVNTDNVRLLAMQIKMFATSWETTNMEELLAKFERQRTPSTSESLTSQAEAQTKLLEASGGMLDTV